MQGKFAYFGEGAAIPITGIGNFGLGANFFKIWIQPTGGNWIGYTTASNDGLAGIAFIETPIVQFSLPSGADETPFVNFINQLASITITPRTFVSSGGVASIVLSLSLNDGTAPQLSFSSSDCAGFSLVAGSLQFSNTMIQQDIGQWDPTTFVPQFPAFATLS
jgi:hypothetical protein